MISLFKLLAIAIREVIKGFLVFFGFIDFIFNLLLIYKEYRYPLANRMVF